jgi:hypothetical protein
VRKFMVILHQDPARFRNLPPDQMQQVFGKYRAWADKVRATNRYVVSDKLAEEGGRVMTLQGGRPKVIDGPYAEAKEVVAGYFTILAEDYDDAVNMVRDCPHINYGGRIEIRQTDATGCGAQ